MKLQCKKCDTFITVSPDVKRAADPRVVCPQCGATYRLRKSSARDPGRPRPTPTPSAFTASLPPQSQESSGVGTPAPPAQPSRVASESPPPASQPATPVPPQATTSPPQPSPEDAPTRLMSPSSASAQAAPTAGAPGSGAPGSGAPGSGAPGSGAPGSGAPGSGAPGSGAPGSGAPGTGAPATGAPAAALTPISGPSSGSHPGGPHRVQAFQAGSVLAERYRIVRFLAHGGMGEVYEAEDLELKESLALKTISPAAGATQDVATIDRFKREIALARAVTHPNVCRIFDLGQHTYALPNGRRHKVTFLTMELLSGETLSARLRRRTRLSTAEALPLVQQMAAALDAAHQAKVVHRDFKCENVFLVPVDDHFRAVVTDFGVARGSDGADQFAAQVTGTGIVGTPSYMAPEQVEGKPVTPAADVYALGVVIYEMLTGKLPFEGPTPLSTAVKRLQEDPPTPRVHVPDIPAPWEKAIMRCLARRPEDRFPTAGAVAAMLTAQTLPPGSAMMPGTGPVPVGLGQTPPPGSPTAGMPSMPTPASTAAHMTAPRMTSPGTSAALPTHPGLPATHGLLPSPGHDPTAVQQTPTPTSAPAVGTAQAKPDAGRQKVLVAVLALVLLVSAGLFAFNQLKKDDQRIAPRSSVAVLGFKNLTGQADADWLATALTEMMSTELARGDALRTISSDQVARVRQELELEDVAALEADDLQRMRSLLACDFVVSGSYTRLGGGDNGLRVDLRLRDAALGEEVASSSRQGSEADLFPMTTELGQEVRGALGIGDAGQDAFAGLPKDGEAARLYAEALELLRGSGPSEARVRLEQAVRREPTNALLHSALSSAWEAEGYRSRAAQSAQRAFELSTQLPQEDRLVVEGHFRELEGDWTAAAEIYTRLWEFFPDDLDYGLRLVAAQNNARRPDLAVAAIDRLRSLPLPLSEDPRIDLAEATSTALLADFEGQLAAAERAAQRAQSLEAPLLHAQAQIARSQALRRLGQLEEAAAAAKTAQQLYDGLGHTAGAAHAATALANALADQGSFDDAASHFRQSIETHRSIGDQATVATGLNNLAMVLREQGDSETALGLYEEALSIYEETENRMGWANTENNLGVLLVQQERLADGLARFQQARGVWEEHGDRAMQAYALNNIAAVTAWQGNLWESRSLHQQALEIRRGIGHKTSEVTSLTNLAGLFIDLGDLGSSQEHLARARQLADETGYRVGQAEVYLQHVAPPCVHHRSASPSFCSVDRRLPHLLLKRPTGPWLPDHRLRFL